MGAQHGLGHGLGKSLHQSGFLLIPYLLPLQVPIMAALACLDAVLGLSWLCPLQLCIPLSCGGLCPSVELFHGVRGAGVGTQLWLGHIGAVERNWSEFQTVLICFLYLVLGISNYMCTLQEQSLGFLQPCCQSRWFQTSYGYSFSQCRTPTQDAQYVFQTAHSPGDISKPM